MSGVRRDSSGRRACDVGGCWRPWPCGLHGAMQAAGGSFATAEGARVVALGALTCPLGSTLPSSVERSCKGCGYHVCSKQGACAPRPAPRDIPREYYGTLKEPSVLELIQRESERCYCHNDLLVEVRLPPAAFIHLVRELSELSPMREGRYRGTDQITVNTCAGPVEVHYDCQVSEPRWRTQREVEVDAALARAKQQMMATHAREFQIPIYASPNVPRNFVYFLPVGKL